MVGDWTLPRDGYWRSTRGGGDHDAVSGWFTLEHAIDGITVQYDLVRDDGRVSWSWRAPRPGLGGCYLSWSDIGSQQAVWTFVHDLPGEGTEGYALEVSLVDPTRARLRGPVDYEQLHLNAAEDIRVCATHVGLNTSPARSVWRLDDGGDPFLLGGWDADRADGYLDDVWDDATFYTSIGVPHTIRVAVGRDPSRPFVELPDGDALWLRTDGAWLVWLQGYERDGAATRFSRYEIWTSPYTDDPTRLEARRVAVLPFHSTPPEGYKVGFGRAATADPNRRDVLYVYDLTSGVRHDWPAPEGLFWSNVLYVGPDEVAATARELRAQTESVLQIAAIDSLDVVAE